MILINLSILMDFMDNKNLWKDEQREKIVKWGNILYKKSHYGHSSNGGRKQSDRWPDTVSKAAAAYMLWGYVNKDLKIFKDGFRDLMKEYNKIPADGKYHHRCCSTGRGRSAYWSFRDDGIHPRVLLAETQGFGHR